MLPTAPETSTPCSRAREAPSKKFSSRKGRSEHASFGVIMWPRVGHSLDIVAPGTPVTTVRS
jgi:hypothetical protein